MHYRADALIFALEDSVPSSDKPSAHLRVRQALERFHNRGPLLAVRINALDTGLVEDGLAAIICTSLAAIVAPKMEGAGRQGTGALTYHGAMVDIAMSKTAQQVLTLARAIDVRHAEQK